MLIAIDALDLLYTDRPDAFGIVSSDADFTPLVMHLRAKGATVYGFGAKKTPEPFVAACSRFLYLESLGEPDAHDERDDRDAAPEDAPPTGAKAGARKPRAATARPRSPPRPTSSATPAWSACCATRWTPLRVTTAGPT